MNLVTSPSAAQDGSTSASGPQGPLPVTHIQPTRGWAALRLSEVWRYRELLYFLVWRDVKVRYKQTVIGAAWVVIQPLITMLMMTIVFGKIANISSDGLPRPVFYFTALLPWGYFAQAVNKSGVSLVGSASLISKVYFPRLIIPLAAVAAPVVDLALAFLVLAGIMAYYHTAPTVGVLLVPAFLLLAMLTALAISLWLSALNVKYRDVANAVPFVVQIWMYASPVVYPLNEVPQRWRMLYSLNPMTGVIEGFRWALAGKHPPDLRALAVSTAMVLLLLVGGLAYFKRTERTFADVV